MEVYGGIGRRARKLLSHLAHSANDKKRGRDGTTYSLLRPVSYYKHHLRAIASAVVFSDARNIAAEMYKVKQRAFEVSGSPTHVG